MDAQQAEDELAAARAAVLAQVEKLGQYGGPTLRPTTLNSTTRLQEPPAEVAGKIDGRLRAGFTAEGEDFPRRSAVVRGAIPAGLAGLLGAILLVVGVAGAILGAGTLTVVLLTVLGLVALGAGVGTAIALSVYAGRDPLRLTAADRHALHETKRWHSRQSWIGPLSSSVERRLVIVARDLVDRIVTSPAWVSGHLDAHRTQLNLRSELDEIDEQAFGLAVLRSRLESGPAVSGDQRAIAVEQGWARLVDRVAGLLVYADRLTAIHEHLARQAAEYEATAADGQVSRLVAGAVRDELAAETLRSLSAELDAHNELSRPAPTDDDEPATRTER